MSYEQFLVQFRILFPEFSGVTDAQLLIYYNQSILVSPSCSNAILYLAGHLVALDVGNNTGNQGDATGGYIDGGDGEVTMEKVGDLQTNFMAMAQDGADTFYTTTPYGRKYIVFRNACPSYGFSAIVYQ